MKLAYIAGPYRASTIHGIVQNIRSAEKVAIKYWQLGYAVICPHTNTCLLDGVVEDQVFLDGTLEMMIRCDVVVMMTTWKDSKGAIQERDIAKHRGMQIIYE
jgi:hypothetical protein